MAILTFNPTIISTVLQKIISTGFHNVVKDPVTEPVDPIVDPESRYIYDNSMNDLLVRSESLINILISRLTSDIERIQNVILLLLIIMMILVVLFVLDTVHTMIKSNRKYNQFMNILLTLSTEEIESLRSNLSLFNTALLGNLSDLEFISHVMLLRTT